MAQWRNRIIGYGEESPGQLLANPRNFRVHPKAQQEALLGVMREVGVVDDVIINQQTGFVVDGHLRVALAISEKQPTVPVKYVDLTEAEESLILATFDPIAAMAATDKTQLDALLRDVSTGDAAVQAMLAELAKASGLDYGAEPKEAPEPQIDKAEELRQKWGTESGQLWTIGRHRLLCGDSTKAEDVARLMAGERAQGIFTSPPYAEQRKEQYGGTPADRYVEWWDAVQANVRAVLAPDGSFFVNIKPHCEDGERHLYVTDLLVAMKRRWHWAFIDEFCWRRRSYPGSAPNRFKNAWEPVYHFAADATGIKFRPRNVLQPFKVDPKSLKNYRDNPHKATGNASPFEVGGKVSYEADGAWPENFIEAFGNVGKEGHAAMFPVELAAFFLKAFSDTNDIWLDPFNGSGTVIAVAEQEGRIGYGMEFLPAYVAVTLERLAAMGLEPRLSDG